ncbi:hypothetical protein [Microbacterium album]|uniref:Uncharacterized protein n=1 Tax=Microbacterium album TaxID=2053191 RepID=A0A917IFG4_9MICO|nr:hypothetical protein [Microbacterium album]GGH44959.1 hypothetical protein GCM10010921_20020 [Microbacterium album]
MADRTMTDTEAMDILHAVYRSPRIHGLGTFLQELESVLEQTGRDIDD